MHYNILLPDNKSIRIRQMIADYVNNGSTGVLNGGECNDIVVTHNAIVAIDNAIKVRNMATIDVEDCGLAYRSILALAAVSECSVLITGSDRLLRRPVMPLVNTLKGIGADITRLENGWQVKGCRTVAHELDIDIALSSQFATALMLTAPLTGLNTLHLKNCNTSLGYLEMTKSCMGNYNLNVPELAESCKPIGAIGDWSAAVFWFAHACLHPQNSYSLHPLSTNSIQSDAVIAEWFGKMGVEIVESNNIIAVSATKVRRNIEATFDMSNNIDLVPVLAALACCLPADFTFKNIRNLKYKESDRLGAIVEQLSDFAEISNNGHTLRVKGRGTAIPDNAPFDTKKDHRLAMAFLLLSNPENLSDCGCLSKSYPLLLKQLGGQ